MKVEHLSQWETGWVEKALPQFRCPFLSDSTDRSNSSYLGSSNPRSACLYGLRQAKFHCLGTVWAVLTNEVSEVESNLQDFSSEEEIVGGRVPS